MQRDRRSRYAERGASPRSVPLSSLSAFAARRGDVVLVPWGDHHYFATIDELEGSTLRIHYEDASTEARAAGLVEMRIVLDTAPPAPPPFACEP